MGTARSNRNQHFVPQFYLRQFATSDSMARNSPKIWAFPIQDGYEFPTTPRNVASQRDLYSCCDERVDNKLADLESLLGKYWPRLSEDTYPIDLGFKRGVSLFVATLYLRHPSVRDHLRSRRAATAQTLSRMTDSSVRQLFAELGVVSSDEAVAAARSVTDEESDRMWGEIILSETGEIARRLVERPWATLISDGQGFVTTDRPVVLSGRPQATSGIAAPDSVIYLPMNPRKLLVINGRHGRDDEIVGLPPGGEDVFNWEIFRNAHRYMFSNVDPALHWARICNFGDSLRTKSMRLAQDYLQLTGRRVARNDPCFCGSGRKFKRCCGR